MTCIACHNRIQLANSEHHVTSPLVDTECKRKRYAMPSLPVISAYYAREYLKVFDQLDRIKLDIANSVDSDKIWQGTRETLDSSISPMPDTFTPL